MKTTFKTLMIAIAILVTSITASLAQDLNKGRKAFDKADYATALSEFRPLAEEGFALAQNGLGLLYANGRGVIQDNAEAAIWYRKAAEQGDADAQRNLGIMYANGQGVPKDDKAAVKWFTHAGEQREFRCPIQSRSDVCRRTRGSTGLSDCDEVAHGQVL